VLHLLTASAAAGPLCGGVAGLIGSAPPPPVADTPSLPAACELLRLSVQHNLFSHRGEAVSPQNTQTGDSAKMDGFALDFLEIITGLMDIS
jgi:hypothetical protein